ncbi:MAG: hypothetical protein GXY19_20605 [Phycisphaerae bacterium]|nr:hypothetical protein [Phycisphaerae bacterium]
MDSEEKIKAYLEDQDLLMREWYRKQVAYATGIDPGEPVSTVEDIKKGFDNWVSKHAASLRKVVCPNMDEIRAADGAFAAVGIISRALRYEEYIGPLLETACFLFVYGAERLCQTNVP